MANKRLKAHEIVSKLRQVGVLMGQGLSCLDAIRRIGVVEQTYYRWRKRYGGMGVDQLKELKHLQQENERLRRAVSDLTLDKLILTEAARGPVLHRKGLPHPDLSWPGKSSHAGSSYRHPARKPTCRSHWLSKPYIRMMFES